MKNDWRSAEAGYYHLDGCLIERRGGKGDSLDTGWYVWLPEDGHGEARGPHKTLRAAKAWAEDALRSLGEE